MIIEDETTVYFLCHSGHREYFYKLDSGKWESSEDRKKRLCNYRICVCGKEYMISDHATYTSVGSIVNDHCPECAKDIIEERIRKTIYQRCKQTVNSTRSPWRIGVKCKKDRVI